MLTRQPRVLPIASLAATLAITAGSSGAQRTPPTASQLIAALAPVEVIASGFHQPSALAVEASGSVLVTDRAAGTLIRISATGTRELLRNDLQGPAGVAVDRAGNIYIIEDAAHRLVRVDGAGSATVVASTRRQPRAIAVGPDDRIWMALRGDGLPRNDDVIARVEESGAVTEIAGGFSGVEAVAAVPGALYIAMERLTDERGGVRTAVARVEIQEDGTVSSIAPLVSSEVRRVVGVGIDMLGDLFVSGIAVGERPGRSGVILKRHGAGPMTEFAYRLHDAAALAFTTDGDLVALELRHTGRLLRFRAPPPPAPRVPPFTNRTPLPIAGKAQPDDRVQLFQRTGGELVATTIADARGEFTLVAPLAANARSEFLLRATAARGVGLSSPRVEVSVVHDDGLPRVMMLEPPAGMHVRGPVALRGRGEDHGSGIAVMTFLLDDEAVASFSNPVPPEPLVASATVEIGGVAEGPHTLTTLAEDRAGNSRAEAQLLIVDRTPPETVIVSGPGGETAERNLRFIVDGTDVWSPALDFSWRLDAGAWSPFGPSTVVDLRDLTPGQHRLEVRTKDLAGNEDPTPAIQTFTVRSLRVRILEPVDGATIMSSSVWIRGTVEAGIGEVTVRIALPPGFDGIIAAPVQQETFAMEVPADPAFATLTVLAADGSGDTAQAAVSVLIAPDGTLTESLELWPPGGVAPLNVRIGLHGFSNVPLSIDVEGDGTDEFTGVLATDDFEATYTRPGSYLPSVRMTLPDGSVLVRRGLVDVYDRLVVDARLKAVWSGFKDALRAGDVDAAVRFIVAERREAWAVYFRALPAEMLQQIDEILPPISFIEAGARGAQYEMVVELDGVMVSYPVWFQIDADGRWRLWRF